ncbi:MAG TPA: hypothetical protein V6D07_11395 [Trichocoleus sp.]
MTGLFPVAHSMANAPVCRWIDTSTYYQGLHYELTPMKAKSPKPLRTNPFLTYRDPETGHWVTVVPSSEQKAVMLTKRPPQVIRVVEPEAFNQMAVQTA